MGVPKPNVLVIDAEPEIVDMYREYLDDSCTVTGATGGEEGLERLDDHTDVVVLDRRMPEMSGDAVADQIKRMPIHTKIVMVTAIEPDMDLLHIEFDDYMVKPVTQADLTRAVDRMTNRIELENQLQELLGLASRLTTLEDKLDIESLETSDKYHRLTDEFTQLKREIRRTGDDSYYWDSTMSKLNGAFEDFE